MSRKEVNESMFRMNIILFFALLGLSILGCLYFYVSVNSYNVDGRKSSYFCDQLTAISNSSSREEFLQSKATWISSDELIDERVESESGCHYGLFFVR